MIKKVYLSLEAGYVWGKGHSKEQRSLFEAEIKRLLSPIFGFWKDGYSASSPMCSNGKEGLYCHPMTTVGLIDIEKTLPKVITALKSSKIITITDVRTFEPKHEDFVWHERKNEIIKNK